MEKTRFAKAVPDPAPIAEGEKYLIHIEATGKTVPLREAPDALLASEFAKTQAQHAAAIEQIQHITNFIIKTSAACAAVGYEIDRRSRVLVAPPKVAL